MGIDIDIIDENKQSAVFYAIKYAKKSLIRIVMNEFPIISDPDIYGKLPIDYLNDQIEEEPEYSSLEKYF